MTRPVREPDRPDRLACAGAVFVTCLFGCALVGSLLTPLPWLAMIVVTLSASGFAFAFPGAFYALARMLIVLRG